MMCINNPFFFFVFFSLLPVVVSVEHVCSPPPTTTFTHTGYDEIRDAGLEHTRARTLPIDWGRSSQEQAETRRAVCGVDDEAKHTTSEWAFFDSFCRA